MNKTNYIEITEQNQFKELVDSINWESAFIKESHFYSPSYLMKGGVVATDSALSLKMAICLPENNFNLIEFKFNSVTDIAISVPYEIYPSIKINHNEVVFTLLLESNFHIKCRTLQFKKLDNYLAGDCPIYTQEDIYFE